VVGPTVATSVVMTSLILMTESFPQPAPVRS
jgi:hypothetical protein